MARRKKIKEPLNYRRDYCIKEEYALVVYVRSVRPSIASVLD
jgi:hypothetical protein